MSAFLVPGAYVSLLWWSATGLILYLNRRPSASFRWSFGGATALAALAAWWLVRGTGNASRGGAYAAFTCAIVLWGWLEAGFLMGFISGPRKTACGDRCRGGRHLLHAVQAVIYNDAATALVIGAVYFASAGAPNRLGFWTLMILWMMRISAKLNLFLGVPNLGEAFLPPHLQYLRSFFHRRPMNWLFPLSIGAASAAAGTILLALTRAGSPFQITSLALSLTLVLLGLLEHAFMVLPLPSERLWNWALHLRGRPKRGRHTPKTMLPNETARSSQSPAHSVRSTSAN